MTAPAAAPTITCTYCQLMIEWSPEKEGMVDIGGGTFCPDLRPHRPSEPPQPWHRWAVNEDPGAPNAHQTADGKPDHCLACGVVRWPLTYYAIMRAAGPCQATATTPVHPQEDQGAHPDGTTHRQV